MESVKFPRRTTRIVEVEEYLRRLGATTSAETAKEVVTGQSSSINEGAVLVDNFVDEVYEFESAPKTASSQLAVVGGRDPDGLSGRTRVFNFSEQACTTDAKAEAIFSKITKIYFGQ